MSFASGLKTIVVATDLVGRSEAALEYARKLATAYGARIVLAHGIDPMEYATVDAVPGRVLKTLPEEARAVLDKLSADLLREGIHSPTRLPPPRRRRLFRLRRYLSAPCWCFMHARRPRPVLTRAQPAWRLSASR